MSKKIPVTNNTAMPMWLGGVMIPPDETRHIDEHHVPANLRPKAQEAEPEQEEHDPILAILGHAPSEIEEMLEALSDDELFRLEDEEVHGEDRQDVMDAIALEKLRRADEKTGDDQDDDNEPPTVDLSILDKTVPEIEAQLPSLSDEALQALKEAETNGKTRNGVMDAIAKDEKRRAEEKADAS